MIYYTQYFLTHLHFFTIPILIQPESSTFFLDYCAIMIHINLSVAQTPECTVLNTLLNRFLT